MYDRSRLERLGREGLVYLVRKAVMRTTDKAATSRILGALLQHADAKESASEESGDNWQAYAILRQATAAEAKRLLKPLLVVEYGLDSWIVGLDADACTNEAARADAVRKAARLRSLADELSAADVEALTRRKRMTYL